MDDIEDEFLPAVINILDRLQQRSTMHGHPVLTCLLEMAKSEAEDDLRTTNFGAHLQETLRHTSLAMR